MIEKIDADVAHEPMWRTFLEKVQRTAKSKLYRNRKEENEDKKKEDVDSTEH